MKHGVLSLAVDTARAFYRAYGFRGVVHRTRHEIQKRRGWYLDAPRARRTSAAAPYLPIDLDRLGVAVSDESLARAQRVAGGEYQAYGDRWLRIPSGDAWQRHPLSGARYPDVPWYLIRHVDPAFGDIKDAWEPARFGWAYDLVRGFARTRDAAFVEAFWRHFDDFLDANPPFRGVQWSCGQETSVRTIAWLWSEAAFAPGATISRRERLADALFVSGERIADAIHYGLSQRNNHAIWEAMALAAIGVRFRSTSAIAEGWVRDGLRHFEHAVLDQFESGGWYRQHSLNYHRAALQGATMMQLALRHTDRRLSNEAIERLDAANRLLHALHDETTGDMPNYGPNDGANPLPLSSANYRDFRPAITGLASAIDRSVPAPFTPDAETLAWLGRDVRIVGHRPALTRGNGWIAARCGRAFLFARATEYRDRPGHFDPAHIELWYDGSGVAIDAGAYRYSAPPPWNDGLQPIVVHNTVDFPAFPIARRGPGFITIGAPAAEIVEAVEHDDTIRIRMRNHTWLRNGILHEREVALRADECVVSDAISGPPGVVAVLQWLTRKGAVEPRVSFSDAPETSDRVSGDEGSVRGWRSLFYAAKEPAVSASYRFRIPAAGSVRITSVFALG